MVFNRNASLREIHVFVIRKRRYIKKQRKPHQLVTSSFLSLPDRARTCGPLIKSQLLYQLSYGEKRLQK